MELVGGLNKVIYEAGDQEKSFPSFSSLTLEVSSSQFLMPGGSEFHSRTCTLLFCVDFFQGVGSTSKMESFIVRITALGIMSHPTTKDLLGYVKVPVSPCQLEARQSQKSRCAGVPGSQLPHRSASLLPPTCSLVIAAASPPPHSPWGDI